MHYLSLSIPGFFQNKVVSNGWINIKSITELDLPSNQFPKRFVPTRIVFPVPSLVNEEFNSKSHGINARVLLP